jgi:hypothetical protein
VIALSVTSCLALILSLAGLYDAGSPPRTAAKFNASTAYGVPGEVLPAGSYSIELVDHLSDRYIVRIDDRAGHTAATFLGLPTKTIGPSSGGKLDWPQQDKGVTYLKGWYFPQAKVGLEFVYPKADAVALAQANHARVAAIDPSSDGMSAVQPEDLSPKDLQIVTLWVLSPTHVGAGSAPGISAKRYDQLAGVSHRPPLRALPHTASNLAWIGILGLVSLAGAMSLSLRRGALRCG